MAIKAKVLSRSKARFPKARGAWTDIARATGARASDVVEKRHTSSHWRFVVKTSNPSMKSKALSRAMKLSEKFFGFKPRRIRKMDFEEPKAFVHIGACAQIDYVNDKFDGKVRQYFHEFGPGTEVFAFEETQPDGDSVLLIKGPFKIKAEGLVG